MPPLHLIIKKIVLQNIVFVLFFYFLFGSSLFYLLSKYNLIKNFEILLNFTLDKELFLLDLVLIFILYLKNIKVQIIL